MNPGTIAVTPKLAYGQYGRLFAALEEVFPVRFLAQDALVAPGADAWIVLDGSSAADARVPAYKVAPGALDVAGPGRVRDVRFADSAILPPALRNRVLREQAPADCAFALQPEPGEDILASCAAGMLWVHQPADHGRGSIDRVALAPPRILADRCLREYLDRGRFSGLLPLVHFLQRVSAGRGWQPPPPRACFVFDDPSLHLRSYGCIDFRELAARAREWRFHAAVATIPIDAGWVNPRTAALFRTNPAQLSLVIHGNDHVFKELVLPFSADTRRASLAQALRRIDALTARHGVDVCRVMEPPYGIIAQENFPAMVALGFEATLVTPRQFAQCNRGSNLDGSLGFAAVAPLAGGLGMIPRIPVSAGWETDACLAAFLGQPVVLAGHHADADGDWRFIAEVVAWVNSLGPMSWQSLSTIARGNFLTRSAGAAQHVCLGSRRVRLTVPAGITEIICERPWLTNGQTEPLHWSGPDGRPVAWPEAHAVAAPIPVRPGDVVELHSPPVPAIDPARVPAPRRSPWPLVRRALTETRDRLYPFLPRTLRRTRRSTLPTGPGGPAP